MYILYRKSERMRVQLIGLNWDDIIKADLRD